MAEPHIPTSLANMAVNIHTAPLLEEAKVLVFVEANASSAHEPLCSHNALKPYLLVLQPNLRPSRRDPEQGRAIKA